MNKMNEFEKQERKDTTTKARKNFNYLIRQYWKVHSHHKSWIEGIFNDLEDMVAEVKLGEN